MENVVGSAVENKERSFMVDDTGSGLTDRQTDGRRKHWSCSWKPALRLRRTSLRAPPASSGRDSVAAESAEAEFASLLRRRR